MVNAAIGYTEEDFQYTLEEGFEGNIRVVNGF